MRIEKEVNEILEKARTLGFTELLYSRKKEGKCPFIQVNIKDKKVSSAKLVVGRLEYWFHRTKDLDGNVVEIQDDEGFSINGDTLKVFIVPFDGYGLNNDMEE